MPMAIPHAQQDLCKAIEIYILVKTGASRKDPSCMGDVREGGEGGGEGVAIFVCKPLHQSANQRQATTMWTRNVCLSER